MYTQQKRSLSLHIVDTQHCSETIIYMTYCILKSMQIYFSVELSNCQNKLCLDFLNYIKIPQIHLYPCLKHCLHFFQSLNWVSDNGDKMSFNTQSTSDMKKSLKSKQICSSAKA